MQTDQNSPPALVALDWGTSSLRAWLLDGQGRVLDSRAEDQGIMHVSRGDYAAVYARIIDGWPGAAALPAIACGMIGSRGGWREAPYVECPADPGALAAQLARVEAGTALAIVPGVLQVSSAHARADVMRGEETQVLGALAGEPRLAGDALLVLPGTHSKWVTVRDARLTGFTTYMTGELFAVLREHSILGQPARTGSVEDNAEVFRLGVRTARDSGAASTSAALFSTRSRWLTGELAGEHTLEYLSGLLIGEEIRSVLAMRGSCPPLRLIGEEALCRRYRWALAQFDITDVAVVEDAARRGLWQIALAAGLIANHP